MVKKEREYSTLLRKLFGIVLILVFFYLAFISIDKYRSFLGIFLSINAIIMANSLIRHYLPYPKKPKNDKNDT